MRPIDVAKQFNISTSTVRKYEDEGLIPPSIRTTNGYRKYEPKHIEYMACVLAMQAGFSRSQIIQVMACMMDGKANEALLICSRHQAELIRELSHAQKTVNMFTSGDIFRELKLKRKLSIQEVSRLIDVPDTTLRHWEKEGLVIPSRNKDNNYRMYDANQIARLLIIKTIKAAVWSLEHVREVLQDFDNKQPEEAYKVALDALNYLYKMNLYQHQGIHALYTLCLSQGLVAQHYQQDYSFFQNL